MPSSPAPDNRVLEFGEFRLEVAERRLTGASSRAVQLSARHFELLLFMLERPRRLLSRKAMMDAVWRSVIVEENSLSQAISALRRLLGEANGEHRYIETVPGVGYRFVAQVHVREAQHAVPVTPPTVASDDRANVARTPLGDDGARAQKLGTRHLALLTMAAVAAAALIAVLATRDSPSAPSEAATPERAIAVLPFANLSSDPEQQLFADGLSEELIGQLDLIDGLRVIGHTSSFAFRDANADPRELGEKLGVTHVLAGGLRRSDGRLRITARLVSTDDRAVLWSDAWDRSEGDVLAVQADIAENVASALRAELGAGEPPYPGWDTEDDAAYERFVLAMGRRHRGGPTNLARAAELLNEAVGLDPNFGRAWAMLSQVHASVAITGPAPGQDARRVSLADAALDRALALAPGAAETLTLELDRFIAQRDWHGAAQTAERLDTLYPPEQPECSRVATFEFYALGRGMERAAICAHESLRVEPLSLQTSWVAQLQFAVSGHHDLANREYARSRDLAGERGAGEYMALDRLWRTGEPAAVKAQMRRALDVMPVPVLEQVYAVLDDRDAARVLLRAAVDDRAYANTFGQVMLATWLDRYGDAGAAAEALYRAYIEHGYGLYRMWYSPSPAVRSQPRYKQLVIELGFIDYFRATGVWNDFCRPVRSDDFDCAGSLNSAPSPTLRR